ncbi:MAG: tripartite tricarboxylate transporter substrate binding protein [Paracoccus sp. (in: a-proteobacteria)]|uniref:Bug family tripartite tricarboxylate transporter substrate binding protein n=1 Tax=Paracoccus sp. TaxID=267 RepID=UPI0032427CD3
MEFTINALANRHVAGIGLGLVLALGAALPNAAGAQDAWPDRPVQFYVPASPGGGTDAVARIIADTLQQQQETPFIVVNAPGGGGAVAAEQVRNADPDGRTLLFFHTGLLTAYHTGAYPNDPLAEFTTLALMPVGGSYALAVPADSPFQTVSDLVDAAKADPGSISVGVQLRGSTHFMGGLLAEDSGATFRFVEAGSDSDKLVQLQGKQINAALINTSNTRQYLDTGALRVLGTIAATSARDPLTPETPSLVEQGYENALFGFDFMVMGPKDMDPALVTTIHDAMTAAVTTPSVGDQLRTFGMPVTALGQADIPGQLEQTDQRIRDTAAALGLN